MNDAASAMVLADETWAEKRGLVPVARLVSYGIAAVEPGTNTDTSPLSTPDWSTTLCTPAVMSIVSPFPSVEKRSCPLWTVRARTRR